MNSDIDIYSNGRIWAEYGRELAEAISVVHGKILAVGKSGEILNAYPQTRRVIDLGGRFVIPGLADAHTHVARHALEERMIECRDFVDPKVDSIAEVLRRFSLSAEVARPDEWILGLGAMRQQARFAERRWPTREELDAAVPNNPCYIVFGSHVTVANSVALSSIGYDEGTPDPHGGKIGRDQATGRLNGLLLEHAGKALHRDLTEIYGFDDLVDSLERSLYSCAERGVTCIHDILDDINYIRAYQRLYEEDRLPIRVQLLLRVLNAEFDLESIRSLGLRQGFGDDWLWLGGGKVSIDGGFTGRSAAFKSTIDGKPLCDPIIRIEHDELNRTIKAANDIGFRMCIHAIGDLAVDQAIAAFEGASSGKANLRNRIEHFGNWLCTPGRLSRCKELGITPMPNPAFLYYLGSDAWDLLGGEQHYASSAFPFRTLLRSGFNYSTGSDGPGYYPIDGLRDLSSLVWRSSFDGQEFDASEGLTIDEALQLQTTNAAWLAYKEDSLGKLAPGKCADFVVLDTDDLRSCAASDIANLHVRCTVVGGNMVYGDL